MIGMQSPSQSHQKRDNNIQDHQQTCMSVNKVEISGNIDTPTCSEIAQAYH